ncbi:cytidine deaminase [Nocardioides alcanivorans]|uniref:cytidine deaminase n=1 Tax=Nocardioides alcanivorans TaxID=2897352 RepID=UPI001F3340BB|nr:cytidine deaminase [Nocardioides alcanivorans]
MTRGGAQPDVDGLAATVAACRDLIDARFPEGGESGAAAVLLADGRILTGTSPEFLNPSTTVCHEIEPYCAAYRLDQPIVASVCLHRATDGSFLVLSPCGVCRERLAGHGPDVRVAVPAPQDPTEVRWITLGEALPHYWVKVFADEVPQWAD